MASDTTVKISRDTLSHLEQLRDQLKARSIDETVRGAARMKEAKVVTADPHFKDLLETIWI